MSRYINADELKKRINSRIGYFELYYPIDTANISELRNCLEIIDNAPTEEVQPIVMGKWILSNKQFKEDVENDNYLFICSKCKCSDIHAKDIKVPYCWNCGAKMEESEELLESENK